MRVRDVVEFSNFLNVVRYQGFDQFLSTKFKSTVVNKVMSYFRDENLSKEMEE